MNYYNDGLNSLKLTRREVVRTKANESRIQKLKYQKMKTTKLSNFIRIEREKILQQRDIEQR